MRVVIADTFSQEGINILRESGIDVCYDPTLRDMSLKEVLIETLPQVLVVRSTRISRDVIEMTPTLELIVRAGNDMKYIDTKFASSQGIIVANTRGKSAIAVSELVMGLMVASDRRIVSCVKSLDEGWWEKGKYSNAKGLYGRTLGLIGSGHSGRHVVVRAKSFGMHIVCFGTICTPEEVTDYGVKILDDLHELARVSDFISVHPAFNSPKDEIVTEEFLSHCKEDLVLINTTRSDAVNDQAVLAALEAHPNMRYACDVFIDMPEKTDVTFNSCFSNHPRIITTQHIGACTAQAEDAVGKEVVRTIQMFAEHGKVPMENCCNVQTKSPANFMLTARVLDKPGMISELAHEIRTRGWHLQEMENLILLGNAARVAIKFQTDDLEAIENFKEDLANNDFIVGASVTKI